MDETVPVHGREMKQSLRKRRIINWINVVVMSICVLGLCILANVIVNAHPKRIDMTTDKLWEVSDHSRKVIQNLKEKLTIYTTAAMYGPYASDRSLPEAWNQVGRLMAELFTGQPKVEVVQVTERTLAFKDFFAQFPSEAPNSLFFSTKSDDGRIARKVVSIYEMFKANPNNTGEILAFNAEGRIISIISQLVSARKKTVYFVMNHSEIQPPATVPSGMSILVNRLAEFDNVEFKPLDLTADKAVPAEADALFIGAPGRDFDVAEVDALRAYWAGGGRIFAAFHMKPEHPARLAEFLEDCGARYNRDYVLDAESKTGNPALHRIDHFTPHPVNQGKSGVFNVLQTASVDPAVKRGSVQAQPTMYISSPSAWAEEDLRPGQEPRFNPGEKQGEINIAVASEERVDRPRVAGKDKARLILWGGIAALLNQNLTPFGHVNMESIDYVMNNFRWLLDREEVIAEPRSPRKLKPLVLTESNAAVVKWISLAALPFLGVILGIMAWFFRRK